VEHRRKYRPCTFREPDGLEVVEAGSIRLAPYREQARGLAPVQNLNERAWRPFHPCQVAAPERGPGDPDPRVAEHDSAVPTSVDRLTDPTAYGGTDADAFDVLAQ
jgi:hypothetical protein